MIDDQGRARLIDCEGTRKIGACLPATTQAFVLRDAAEEITTHCSLENDLRCIAFVMAQMVLFGYFSIHKEYDAISKIPEEKYLESYRPFILRTAFARI